MPVPGPFPSLDDPDVFSFMRRFADLPTRDAVKALFYEGDLWKNELEPVLMPLIEHYDVVVDDAQGLIRW